jgi:hypothetical protein
MTYSDEFKAQYPRHGYGPAYRSKPVDYTRCAASVADGGRSVSSHQCTRKNGHGPHGAWCKTHDPVARKAKSDARVDAWMSRVKQQSRERAFAADCQAVIRQIAAGYNDPRGLAQYIIDKLEGKE